MKSRWAALVDLTSRREDGVSLACFRVLVAAVVAYSLLSIASAGLVEALWVDRSYGGMAVARQNHLLRWLGGATPQNIWLLFGVSLAATLTLGLGLYGRASALVLAQSYAALSLTNGLASGGYDLLITNALWLLVLGDATATHSIDCRRRLHTWTSEAKVLAWPRYAMIWQLVMLYGFTGLQKVGAAWTPGGGYTALYYVMHDPTWMRFDGSFVTGWLPLSQFATALSWHWEHSAFLLPLVYYFRNTADRSGRLRAVFNRFDLRKPWALIGVSMHIGILLMMNVGPFSLISLAYYVALFRPEETRGALARMRFGLDGVGARSGSGRPRPSSYLL